MAIYRKTYTYEIPDKRENIIVTVKLSSQEGEPFEAAILDFENNDQRFSEIPPSLANLKRFDSTNSTRILSLTNVTIPTGEELEMTVKINEVELSPSIKGKADEDGITLRATLKFK